MLRKIAAMMPPRASTSRSARRTPTRGVRVVSLAGAADEAEGVAVMGTAA
jgi:hypothetical protein